MKIDRFRFEIYPASYIGIHGGNEKVLDVSVDAGKLTYHTQRVIHDAMPWENEIEYFTRMAASTLSELLKKELTSKD